MHWEWPRHARLSVLFGNTLRVHGYSEPKEFPLGLLDRKFGLTKEEVEQVKQANSLIGISQEAIEGMLDLSRPFWWENPDHGDDKVHMWSTPMAQAILDKDHVYMAALDQCVFGAETTKPTIFAFWTFELVRH